MVSDAASAVMAIRMSVDVLRSLSCWKLMMVELKIRFQMVAVVLVFEVAASDDAEASAYGMPYLQNKYKATLQTLPSCIFLQVCHTLKKVFLEVLVNFITTFLYNVERTVFIQNTRRPSESEYSSGTCNNCWSHHTYRSRLCSR